MAKLVGSITAFCFLMFLFMAYACRHESIRRQRTCTAIRPYNGLIRCNGKFVSPSLGTIYYQNLQRQFVASGANSQCFTFNFIDPSSGAVINTSTVVRVAYNTTDSSVLVSDCTPAPLLVVAPSPNPNWYDTCTGRLYMQYSWMGNTRQVCDTCFFN
jgi:hypothetical protein